VYSDHETSLFKSLSWLAVLLHVIYPFLVLGCKTAPLFISMNLSVCHPGLILPLVLDRTRLRLLPKQGLLSFRVTGMAMPVLS